MKIYHLSDTHGWGFWDNPLPPDTDVIVHTGDLLPNVTRGIVDREVPFQTDWINRFVEPIKRWLADRPLIYVPGNHDYIELVDFLPATRAGLTPVQVAGLQWIGFREIPYIAGEWAGEVQVPEMAAIISDIFDGETELSAPGDVLLCHAPPSNILDSPPNNPQIHYGISTLTTALQYRPHRFRAVLFGHIHQNSYLQITINNTIYSNAAYTTGGTVELP
jgi:Icc-related predicted phosphoesterase